jgi:hypothetical protein
MKYLETRRNKQLLCGVSSNLYISILIFFLKMMDLWEKLLPTQCLRAVHEELSGSLLREVIDSKGEHYVEGEEHYMQFSDLHIIK